MLIRALPIILEMLILLYQYFFTPYYSCAVVAARAVTSYTLPITIAMGLGFGFLVAFRWRYWVILTFSTIVTIVLSFMMNSMSC